MHGENRFGFEVDGWDAERTLTIDPGTVIKFQAFNVDLRVEGTLDALGTGAQTIVFTEIRDDTGGDTNGDADASSPGRGNWGRIEVTGAATIRNAQIRYGGFSSAGQVQVDGGIISLGREPFRWTAESATS